jgi:hypothetical protein
MSGGMVNDQTQRRPEFVWHKTPRFWLISANTRIDIFGAICWCDRDIVVQSHQIPTLLPHQIPPEGWIPPREISAEEAASITKPNGGLP